MQSYIKKINLKLIYLRFAFVLLGVAVGLLFMAQLRTIPDRITNPATPTLSLSETKELLYSEQTELASEAAQLRDQNNQLQSQIKSKSASQQQAKELEQQQLLAGLTDVSGNGLAIDFDDSKRVQTSDDAIVHAADLRDTVNLLWGSGAEAISINGQRVVFSTAIDCVVNTILVNNTKISTPFVIKAIGDTERLKIALDSPLNLSDIKQRVRSAGLIFNVNYNDKISIEPFNGSFIMNTEVK